MGGIPWTKEEDQLLRICVEKYGEGKWHRIPLLAGLGRCRKSCRLRWLNYLRPNIKRGDFDEDEVNLIIKLHRLLGNRWSLVAARLPGRTGNDVKNYWNCHLRKKLGAQETHEDNMNHCAGSSNNIVQVMRPEPSTNINIIGQPSLMLGHEHGSSSSVPVPMPVPVPVMCNTNESSHAVLINYQKLQMDHMNIGGAGDEQINREMGDFGMDLRFEEQVKEYEDEDDKVNHKWIWDDSILDMDLWAPYS